MSHNESNHGATVTYGSRQPDRLLEDRRNRVGRQRVGRGARVTVGGQSADVVGNTTDTLTLFSAWSSTPTGG